MAYPHDALCFVTSLEARHRERRGMVREILKRWAAPAPRLAVIRREETVRPAETGRGEETQLTADARELRRLLLELRAALHRHFQEEEDGGCLEEAVARAPRVGALVDALEHQHDRLLGQLDAVLRGLARLPTGQAAPEEVLQAFEAFAEDLHAHEIAESRVLEEGFNLCLHDHPLHAPLAHAR